MRHFASIRRFFAEPALTRIVTTDDTDVTDQKQRARLMNNSPPLVSAQAAQMFGVSRDAVTRTKIERDFDHGLHGFPSAAVLRSAATKMKSREDAKPEANVRKIKSAGLEAQENLSSVLCAIELSYPRSSAQSAVAIVSCFPSAYLSVLRGK